VHLLTVGETITVVNKLIFHCNVYSLYRKLSCSTKDDRRNGMRGVRMTAGRSHTMIHSMR